MERKNRKSLGKTKDYLRYVHDATFGVVAASQTAGSCCFLQLQGLKDRYLAVPANEDVIIWDLKKREAIKTIVYESESPAEVTIIEPHDGGHATNNLIAVGYSNGHVRIFEYETGNLKCTFKGHRTAISALRFDKDASRLASGGKDCTVALWDVPGERGLFSLKGHKNVITKLAFAPNAEHSKDLLISSSNDPVSNIKFWDLQTQHCFLTIPGHANGVWSFLLYKNGSRLISGSAGPELKVYKIEYMQPSDLSIDPDDQITSETSLDYGLRVQHLGNILRSPDCISNRVQDIVVDVSEKLMICHSVDRNMEIYGIRSDEEALSYAKKQAKKERRRQLKRKIKANDKSDDEEEAPVEEVINQVTSLDALDGQSLVDCEINKKFGCHKLPDKIKAVAIVKIPNPDSDNNLFRVGVMSSVNSIDTFQLEPQADNREDQISSWQSMSNLGHRSDVRSISISNDRSIIMSCSKESLKVWRSDSRQCVCTVDVDHASCCIFAEAQHIGGTHKNRFALIGNKLGKMQIIDLAEASETKTIVVCDKPITSMFTLPDRSGIVVGSNDGMIRFYNFAWEALECDEDDSKAGQIKQTLNLELDRTMQFQEGVTSVKVSANSKFVAVALLDSTVRVHFMDTFKYFLTLYGHKFPVTAIDISDDSNLIVTGSPDKNIKIWGLDFGDCHKSIFAHDDIITALKFVPKTHHVFSAGRDCTIKQWDCDHFIKIQTLKKHQGEIHCLDVSSSGKMIVTGSRDKSIRLYRKTDEILVPAEEEENEREIEDERNVYEKQEINIIGETNVETGFAPKMTVETVKSTDRLIESIDVFLSEQAKDQEYIKQCDAADSNGEPRPPKPEHDPVLLTTMTTDYHRFILEILRRIKSSELEEILLTLPFDYVRKLLSILVILLEKRWDIELLVRCSTFLLRVNSGQIAAAPAFVPMIGRLKAIIDQHTFSLRDSTGFNMIALDHLKQNRTFVSTKLYGRG